mgnify:CR=1 FL=1
MSFPCVFSFIMEKIQKEDTVISTIAIFISMESAILPIFQCKVIDFVPLNESLTLLKQYSMTPT